MFDCEIGSKNEFFVLETENISALAFAATSFIQLWNKIILPIFQAVQWHIELKILCIVHMRNTWFCLLNVKHKN